MINVSNFQANCWHPAQTWYQAVQLLLPIASRRRAVARSPGVSGFGARALVPLRIKDDGLMPPYRDLETIVLEHKLKDPVRLIATLAAGPSDQAQVTIEVVTRCGIVSPDTIDAHLRATL